MGCLECGTELTQTPGKRAKTFCNVTCRSNYWQKNKRKKSGKGIGKSGRPSAKSPKPATPIMFIDGPVEVPTVTYLRGDVSFQDLLAAAKSPLSDKKQVYQLTQDHKKLTPGQKGMIFSKLKQ